MLSAANVPMVTVAAYSPMARLLPSYDQAAPLASEDGDDATVCEPSLRARSSVGRVAPFPAFCTMTRLFCVEPDGPKTPALFATRGRKVIAGDPTAKPL